MRGRILFYYTLLVLAFGLLALRLFVLMVVEGARNRELSEGQRIRIRKITAPRGMIFDRRGKPLVRNIPVYRECPASGGVQSASLAESRRAKCKVITREEALKLEAQDKESDLVVDVGREYPYGEAMAHLLGYLGEVNEEEVKNPKLKVKSYNLGDLTGRTGIEEQYEDILRGVDGGELVEVNSVGQTVRKIGRQEPVAGRDIRLSVDADLQVVAWESLKDLPVGRQATKGAVVIQEAKTGQVLALVSSPSFDPNKLTEEVLHNPDYPLFNRAISGAYPPGSTFKIITATAGLEEGKIDAQTKIEDPGVITVGVYKYTNWYFTQYGKTEGVIDLVQAIKRSTDTFFYKVGEFVGAKKLVEWGKAFGLSKASGIDLPNEIGGFLPDPQGEWFLGNTYHLAIGQGHLGLTPLQVNMMTGVIASGGQLCRPEVRAGDLPAGPLRSEASKAGREGERVKECRDLRLKSETLRLIKEGMREACSPGGTAFPFFDFDIPGLPAEESQHEARLTGPSAKTGRVACKTGTAEFNDPAGRTHAWLTAFVPADNPEVVVTALVEAGGEGSSIAAPIVKRVLIEYFRK